MVYPTHLRVKARQVRHETRHLGALYTACEDGTISFGEFDASMQGWINHLRFKKSTFTPLYLLGAVYTASAWWRAG